SQYGLVRGLQGRYPAARALLTEAIDACEALGNFRLQGWALANRARFLTLMDAPVAAEIDAARAVELLSRHSLRPLALAAQARAVLTMNQIDRACTLAQEAVDRVTQAGGLIGGDVALCHLVLGEALLQRGDRTAAAQVLCPMARKLNVWADALQ